MKNFLHLTGRVFERMTQVASTALSPAQIRHRGAHRAPAQLPGGPHAPQASIGQPDIVRGNGRGPWKALWKKQQLCGPGLNRDGFVRVKPANVTSL